MKKAILTSLPLAAALTFGWAPAAAPAHAAGSAAYECTHSNGVWVTVQVKGAERAAGCYRGGGTGLDALRSVTSVAQKSNGLICQVAGYPADNHLCREWDTTKAPYWFYFTQVPAGSGWAFSNFGAQNRSVVPGTVEGWNFGTGLEPSDPPSGVDLTPPAAPTPPPAPAPAPGNGATTSGSGTQGDSGPTSGGQGGSGGGSSSNPAPGAQSESASGAPHPGTTTTTGADGQQTPVPSPSASESASGSATPSASATATPNAAGSAGPSVATATAVSAPATANAQPADAPAEPKHDSPVGLLVTLGVVALGALGAGGWWYTKMRGSL